MFLVGYSIRIRTRYSFSYIIFFSFSLALAVGKTVTCMIRSGIVEWKSFSCVVCTCGGDIFS